MAMDIVLARFAEAHTKLNDITALAIGLAAAVQELQEGDAAVLATIMSGNNDLRAMVHQLALIKDHAQKANTAATMAGTNLKDARSAAERSNL